MTEQEITALLQELALCNNCPRRGDRLQAGAETNPGAGRTQIAHDSRMAFAKLSCGKGLQPRIAPLQAGCRWFETGIGDG